MPALGVMPVVVTNPHFVEVKPDHFIAGQRAAVHFIHGG